MIGLAIAYLALMLINVVVPTGLSSPRAYFNLDWITLLVIAIIAIVGAIYFLIGRPDKPLRQHLHDELEPTGAERAEHGQGLIRDGGRLRPASPNYAARRAAWKRGSAAVRSSRSKCSVGVAGEVEVELGERLLDDAPHRLAEVAT